jgi:uncharacterized protein (TIGR03118 family)
MRRVLRRAEQLGTERPGSGGTGSRAASSRAADSRAASIGAADSRAASIGAADSRAASSRAASAAISLAAAGLVAVAAPASAATTPDSFAQTNLIASNASYKAKLTDRYLANAWGIAAAPTTPIWVSDNNSGFAGVYSGGVAGGALYLDFSVPVPNGHPTGQVFNPDPGAFPVGGPNGSPADLIVDTDSNGALPSTGQIEAWDGGASFVVEDSTKGGAGGKVPARAVFTGLALAAAPAAGPELFAADVADGRIDVFDSHFRLLSTPAEFRDPRIPAGYVPFNVQNLGRKLVVTYARQNHAKTGVLDGKGSGFVDVYTVSGQLIKHLAGGGPLDAPWGLAIAPKGFGPFSGYLLVANQGNGRISAFNPATGNYVGSLETPAGQPVAISGLWALAVGNATFGGPCAVVFSSGPRGYRDGLIGILTPARPTRHQGVW